MRAFDGEIQQVAPQQVEAWQRRHAQSLSFRVHGPLFQRLVAGGSAFLLMRSGEACGYARSCGPDGPVASLAGLHACQEDAPDWLPALRKAGFDSLLLRSDDPGLAEIVSRQPAFAAYYFAPAPPLPIHPTQAEVGVLERVRTPGEAAWLAALVASTDASLGGMPGLTAAAVLAGEPGRQRWLLRAPEGPQAAACRLLGTEGFDDTEVVVPPALRGRGLGGRALAGLIACCRAAGRGVLSGIAHDNQPSRGMARKAGLRPFCQLTWHSL